MDRVIKTAKSHKESILIVAGKPADNGRQWPTGWQENPGSSLPSNSKRSSFALLRPNVERRAPTLDDVAPQLEYHSMSHLQRRFNVVLWSGNWPAHMDTRFFRQQTAVQSSDSLEEIPREMFHVVLCGLSMLQNVVSEPLWPPGVALPLVNGWSARYFFVHLASWDHWSSSFGSYNSNVSKPCAMAIWLVVEPYPSEKYEFVSWDDDSRCMENKNVSNHQPAIS